MMALIMLSLIATTIISSIFGFGAWCINPELGWGVFWLSYGFILIIMEPVNRILRSKTLKAEARAFEKASELGETANKQFVELDCEYCGESNPVNISLNDENTFACAHCTNLNKVMISFATTRTSLPVDMSIAPEHKVIDELTGTEGALNDEPTE